ncbi:hypothetical protein BD289DRAFT_32292 [Coniella lustricola]|uniref:Uncharacterized protein n=1 Tax=Coniella lustricola TaxID=2025994 RepID=A0A2T3A2Q4_9PEZI|nr:hypothetical protein BD289DRAFT_32292 [Coniella lustricola]
MDIHRQSSYQNRYSSTYKPSGILWATLNRSITWPSLRTSRQGTRNIFCKPCQVTRWIQKHPVLPIPAIQRMILDNRQDGKPGARCFGTWSTTSSLCSLDFSGLRDIYRGPMESANVLGNFAALSYSSSHYHDHSHLLLCSLPSCDPRVNGRTRPKALLRGISYNSLILISA